MFGIVSRPALRTVMTRLELSASFCRSGKLAPHDLDGKLALGLVGVLALAAAATGSGDQPGEGDRPMRARPPRLQSGANIPSAGGARGTPGSGTVAPGGGQGHGIGFLRETCLAGERVGSPEEESQ